MMRRIHAIVALGLALALFLLSGLVYPQAVRHAPHHAHHTAGMHGTVLCSWLCTAGHAVESVRVPLLPPFHVNFLTDVTEFPAYHPESCLAAISRGPPLS